MFIGLVGQNGSGKGAVAEILLERGFSYTSLSDIVREEATKKGRDHSRDNLIKTANELRAIEGPAVFAERTVKKLIDKNNFVIDSIRHPKEVETLRKLNNFKLLKVTAPIDLRFERVMKRGRNENAETLEEFKKRELIENKKSGDNVQRISDCEVLADIEIDNSGTLEELKEKVIEIFDNINKS